MSFDTEGFFSPEMARFREAIRTAPECKPWFDFAAGLNRLGLDMLKGHETPLDDSCRLAVSGFFVRTHRTFQGAILLIESGMIGDARSLIRTGVEGAIALHALASDPKFVDQLIAAHHKNQSTVANVVLGDPSYRTHYSSKQIAEMKATLAENAELKYQSNKAPKAIKWAEVADKYCKDLYHTLYRVMSEDGVHTTLTALNRCFESNGGEITQLNVGPDAGGAVEALRAACLMFMWAADPFARTYDKVKGNAVSRLKEFIPQFDKLPRDEPNW
jgi:hypothetical protein